MGERFWRAGDRYGYTQEIGWGNDTTPLSKRSQADQTSHRYCTQRRNEAIAELAADDIIRHYYAITRREREEYSRAVEDRTDAERSDAHPTPDDELVAVQEEILDQLAQQGYYGLNVKQRALVGVWVEITTRQDKQQHRQQQQERKEEQQRKQEGEGVRMEPEEPLSPTLPPPPLPPMQQPPQKQLEEKQQGKQEEKRVGAEAEESMPPPTPPPLWSDEPDWWLDRVLPPPPPPPPAIKLPVDDGSLRGRTVDDILTARSGFSFGRESVEDETMDGDGGKRGARRMRVGSIMGAGWRAHVVGLGSAVQRRRRRCPLRSRLREKEKIIIGLEGSLLGFPGLRMI